ncbi:hypothetical protein TTHERM_00304210 (macronuclear) [Tetrahymena thermophila SB210]|uniref:Uncharacterized protein n=1 Tax=Tetrahymena thermophila (strain SB210) TaxID=312017 RepID=I7LW34_TETTS|nr:hypothetical protein TTHERM_00304210 [Tetrahymena thermophila SB210]EAS00753.2 hypothetical protein TTHERM_00304210 [Tetrahymena thermophila SB210]|eukprot:XP_001020998.2 hypothetical protein TTHERM_00304210 [Tetrahymena thermophila SB210]
MDEDIMLELLAEYSGNWKDRQYFEHIVREIQKKQHLSQLIQEHNHDPRDQLMLEASKRKTVLEIEKKYQQSVINSTYVFPRKKNIGKAGDGSSVIAVEDATPNDDSYNNSLDVDFYNLKAQNTKKKRQIIKVPQSQEQNGKGAVLSMQSLKANVNNSQQSNESNSLSPISRVQQQQNNQAQTSFSQSKNINLTNSNQYQNKGEGLKQNIQNGQANNNENFLRNIQKEDQDEKINKVQKIALNQSQEKFLQNGNQNQNANQLANSVNSLPLNNNNNQLQQKNVGIISPNKQTTKIGINEAFSPSQIINKQNQLQSNTNTGNKSNANNVQQQQYQKTFLQNQIIKQQQQAILRNSQEDNQAVIKQKNDRNSQHAQRDKESYQGESGAGTRLNTCTNDTEKDPEIISKIQKQVKSQSNSPISKVNGQVQSLNGNYYLSPQQQQLAQQNQNQQQNQNSQGLQIKSNPATQQISVKSQNNFQYNSKNQNLSSIGNGKELLSQNQKLNSNQISQKDLNKHSNLIDSILNRQQQQYSAVNNLMNNHQILNTQESANGNEDSSLSLNQFTQQSAKSQNQYIQGDNDQQQILKQIHNQNLNQNNIYNSKKLYQLNTNVPSNNILQQQQQQQLQQLQNQQNVIHNKQRKLVQQNGIQQNVNQNSGHLPSSLQQQHLNQNASQQNQSPFTSYSQQNIVVQNNSQIQYLPSNEQISSNSNLDQGRTNMIHLSQNQNNQAQYNTNGQVAYLNDNVVSSQNGTDNQQIHTYNQYNEENSLAIDSQRKNSVRSKRSGGPNGIQDDQDQKHLIQNSQQNLQFSQTHSSQYKNKWIDFKKINQQYKGSERVNGGAINQTQLEDHNSAAANYRNTFSSVSPNGHQSTQNNSKKGQSTINNYLSLSSAINNIGNSPSIQQNSTIKNKQGMVSSMTQSNHFLNQAINNSNIGQPSLQKVPSSHLHQNQHSNLASSHLNMQQNLQTQNSQELAAYQIKSGKLGLTENQSIDKNYHTQFINNAKQFHQQQQFLLQQNQAIEENNQNQALNQKNAQRKQINKVNSCKSFEIRDKFNKTATKNNPNNIIINLSNVNGSNNNNYHNLYAQNLNHTTGNHNMSALNNNNNNNNNNNSNINSSTINQNSAQNNLLQSQLFSQQNNNNTQQNKQNLLSSSQNIISYLPTSQSKNTYSAALYQKSQNNILSKQAKNPTENTMSNLFNNIHSNSSNNMLSNSGIVAISGQNGVNSSVNIPRNTSQNANGSTSQSINNLNLNSYLTNHNQNSNTKLAKKIDMYKVFNSTNSNSFSNQKEQQASVKQAKNLGLVLQKIIKNKTLKINEKSNQLNQQIQLASNQIQSNLAQTTNINNNYNNQTAKKQSTPGKKKMSTSGNSQQNNFNNSNIKSPQFSSQLKKNYI